jgi:hypothetical protein
MKIIVLRIPKGTMKTEVVKLFEESLAKKFRLPFTKEPRVASVRIFIHEDDQQFEDYYAVVEVLPDKYGHWLLRHFKNKHLHGKLVFIREYVDRYQRKHIDIDQDRRIGSNTHESESLHVEGLKAFGRKFQ